MKKKLFLLAFALYVLFTACNNTKPQEPDKHDHEIASDYASLTPDGHEGPEHTIITLKKQTFNKTIRTSGRIIADNRDVEVITSRSSGIVRFSSSSFFPGVKVSEGQHLFTISGGQLADDNIDVRFRQVSADLAKAKADFERAEKLISEKIITQEHYLTVKNEYEKISEEYINLSRSIGESGSLIYSPASGYVREIFVTEGERVTSGQTLASVFSGKRLVLQADLPLENISDLKYIEKARFKTGYSQRVFDSEEMNGKKISSGKSLTDKSYYIPVYFSIDYDAGLVENTFAEIYLIAGEISDALVVPNSALMEEYGKLYVFVETSEGNFIKRYITTGGHDGIFTLVTNGLIEGEKVVATGAYNVKLSQFSSQVPSHSHNH